MAASRSCRPRVAAFEKLDLEGDEATGANIVRVAAEAPLKQIAINAGLEGGVVAEKVRNLKPGHGLNAATGEYVDMVAEGIIDPAKVTRSALQNAASIAALFLTTEAVVADKPEKAAGHAGPVGRHGRHGLLSPAPPRTTQEGPGSGRGLSRRVGAGARRRRSADVVRPELHADPRPDGLRGLEHRVLPGPLARAAHHQQVAVADRERDRLAAASAAAARAGGPRRATGSRPWCPACCCGRCVSPCQATLSRPSR